MVWASAMGDAAASGVVPQPGRNPRVTVEVGREDGDAGVVTVEGTAATAAGEERARL